jgi:hypothetical protein
MIKKDEYGIIRLALTGNDGRILVYEMQNQGVCGDSIKN